MSFITRDDLIDFMVKMDEDEAKRKKYVAAFPLVYAKLKLGTFKTTVTRKLQVNKKINSVNLPDDVYILTSVGYQDSCLNLKPLWYNEQLKEELLFEGSSKCSCNCGCDGKCWQLKSSNTLRERIVINNIAYEKTITINTLGNGSVQKEIIEPILKDTGEVVMVTSYEEICKIDLKPCGCPKQTEENKCNIDKVNECNTIWVGCEIGPSCCTEKCMPDNPLGYKLNMQGNQIILPSTYKFDNVVIKYYSNKQAGSQTKIPTYAARLVMLSIKEYVYTFDDKANMQLKGKLGFFGREIKMAKDEILLDINKISSTTYSKIIRRN